MRRPAPVEPPWEPPEDSASLPALTSWEAVDLGPILKGEQVTPPPTVFAREDGINLFYRGCLNAIVGPSESCKSFGVAVAATQQLAEGAHVIIVDFEDVPERIVERLRALGATPEQIETKLTYIAPDGRFGELERALLTDVISERGGPTLAVVDGVTAAMSQVGLDPNAGPDVAAFYAGFPRWLARAGAAVALVDHVTKSTEGRGRWAIGSERKISGLDGAAYLFDVIAPFGRGRTGRVKVTVSKDRAGYVRQHEVANRQIGILELRSWPDGGVTATLEVPEAAGQGGTFRPTHLMERMSRAIADSPGLTVNALRAAVPGNNGAKGLALELLVNEGYVEVETGPNRSRQHRSLQLFRESDRSVPDDEF